MNRREHDFEPVEEPNDGERNTVVRYAKAVLIISLCGVSYLMGNYYPFGAYQRKPIISQKTEFHLNGHDVFRHKNSHSEDVIMIQNSDGDLVPLTDYVQAEENEIMGEALGLTSQIQMDATAQIADLRGQANSLEDSLFNHR